MTLGILLPTRGRPANLHRFIEATGNTATDWHLYLRFDFDDPEARAYDDVLETWYIKYKNRITVTIGERIGFAASLNELAARAEWEGISHLGMFGDDVEPVSMEWDAFLIAALRDQLGVVYGDDGLRNKHAPDLPTHYVTQTEVYRRLGYLAPPTIRHLFLDNVARDVGRYLKNFVYVPVAIPHHHPWADGEHLHDLTYAEGGRNADLRLADRIAYIRWTQDRSWKKRLRG